MAFWSLEGLLVHFSYLAVFVLIASSSVFLPLPEEIVLLLAGYLAAVGFLKLPFAILIALAGTLVGDNISFWMGRTRGLFFFKPIQRFLSEKRLNSAERYFYRNSGMMVFIARFIVGFRFLGPVIAGASGMKWKRFQLYNLFGALIWIPLITILGYFLGSRIEHILNDAHTIRTIVLVIAVVLIAGSILYLLKKRKHQSKKQF